MSVSFLSAWLAEAPRALSLLGPDLRSPVERLRVVRAAASRRISPELASALRAQNSTLPASAARTEQLEALAEGGSAAVVTGQQVGLFLGPLFTFYKAASAIVVAHALEKETGVRCVPVFWVQNEDHDFAEINHCWLPGPMKVALPDDDLRMSVAHRPLGTAVEHAIAELTAELESLPAASEFLDLLRTAYRSDQGMSRAFTQLLAACFSEEGMVFVDPRDPVVGTLTLPILKRAIDEHVGLETQLQARSTELAAQGFSDQVTIREGSPLCFYHRGSEDGPRYRLQTQGTSYALIGADETVSAEALSTLGPLRLSSSALLRPLVQDSLLPTAAYIGGPGELSYFAQLAPLYRHFDLPQPAFALRARLRCVDAHTQSLLERVGTSAAEIEQPRSQLLAQLATSPHPTADSLRPKLLSSLSDGLTELDRIAGVLDENLRKPILRTRQTVEHAIDRLLERYAHSRAEKDSVLLDRIARLQAILYPADTPQERFFGLPYFACRYGLTAFKQQVIAAIRPFDWAIRDIHP